MLIKIIVGDSDEDICGKQEIYIFESNVSLKEFNDAYKVGTEKLKLDIVKITKERFSGSENLFTKEEKKILANLEIDTFWISVKDFVKAIIKIAQIGNPKIVMEYKNIDTFYAGGYGLFSY